MLVCCQLGEEFCGDCSGVILWPLWKLTFVYSICLHQNALTCSELKFFELEFHWIENYWRKMTSFANCTVMCMNLFTWLFYNSENIAFVHTLYLCTVCVPLQHHLYVISVRKTQYHCVVVVCRVKWNTVTPTTH